MSIASKYNPKETEDKWYQFWIANGFFRSVPDQRKPYTIVIPPPNVTGVLHMGHMLNNTIQDILIRRARMTGYNACWVPGTDHASIATEARVVAKLKNEGIDKNSLSREEFLRHAWEWKEKHGGIILEQLKKLGASCDWERTKFTMDEDMSESVIKVFVDLYKKGNIYRGVRMVNWDPQAKTAVSDEEVNYREVKSKLYHVKYRLENSSEFLTIATTRPETILGDTAVCVNPADERYKHLKGKSVIVPLINRVVPIIEDDYVDVEFGTGCLKITPAHDINDYEIGLRHGLGVIDIFNDDGTLSSAAELYVGTDRFMAREMAVNQLEQEGLLVKVEDYINKIGYSERTDAVIEPKLSVQWFLKMNKLAGPALENVLNDTVNLIPAKFKNTYRHWMENVKDWCISRQLWWGQRIPAYYIEGANEYVVAENLEEALNLARAKTGNNRLTASQLRQDEDVLDTWFSSWLWPISVFDGIRNPDNTDLKYYYPTSDLVTAPDILFFWVARMVMAGYEYFGEKPFSNVYLTGMVRDNKRRKMSKSLGNSPDPLDLIEKYSADGIRVGMLLCSAAGNDLLYDDSLPEQGRNFANKIWNAFRLVNSWQVSSTSPQPEHARLAITWFYEQLKRAATEIDENFTQYRISEALMTLYRLFWDDFSSWYLELVKPDYEKLIDKATLKTTIDIFENLLKLLHPFMPFITEEIWHLIGNRADAESIMLNSMPGVRPFDREILQQFDNAKEVVTFVRNTRTEKHIPHKQPLKLLTRAERYNPFFDAVISRLAHLPEIEPTEEKPSDAAVLITLFGEYYLLLGDRMDKEEEIKRTIEELSYTKGFLQSVMKKLENRQFVDNAPAKVVEMEQKKQTDAEAKIRVLEELLARLQAN